MAIRESRYIECITTYSAKLWSKAPFLLNWRTTLTKSNRIWEGSLLALVGILNTMPAKAQDLSSLYYVNSTYKVDHIQFLTEDKKLVYSKPASGARPFIYLLDKHNIITDTLNVPVFFQELLFINSEKVVYSGMDRCGEITLNANKFEEEKCTSKPLNDIGLWRAFYLDSKYWGLKDVKNKGSFLDTEFGVYEPISGKYQALISESKRNVKVKRQRSLDITYFISDTFVQVYVFPEQALYLIEKSTLSVEKVQFKSEDLGVVYYFFDHTSGKHYLVSEKPEKPFELFLLEPKEKPKHIATLSDFPSSVVSGKVHFSRTQEDGQYHYLIDISNTSSNQSKKILLEEVQSVH